MKNNQRLIIGATSLLVASLFIGTVWDTLAPKDPSIHTLTLDTPVKSDITTALMPNTLISTQQQGIVGSTGSIISNAWDFILKYIRIGLSMFKGAIVGLPTIN